MRQWRLLRTGNRSPAENMAIDEAILIAYGKGGGMPTIRFYGWNPPTLSIGCFQRAEREIDFDRLQERGIGFVRRPTGGRAVLHDRELTYSLVVSERDVPRSVTESYRELSVLAVGRVSQARGWKRTWSRGRTASGGPAGRLPPARPLVSIRRRGTNSSSTGAKIAGSAQMRSRGAVLQHGSVPLELDADKLFCGVALSERAGAGGGGGRVCPKGGVGQRNCSSRAADRRSTSRKRNKCLPRRSPPQWARYSCRGS